MSKQIGKAVVVGAGIGGLASAVRLLAAGFEVTVLERQPAPGGKIRQVPSAAGPVDAGPTVLTLKPVFEALFAALGAKLEDHLTLRPLPVIARHFWPDGTQLDLHDTYAKNLAAIESFAGPDQAHAFARFHRETALLFDQFDAPMMRAAEPSVVQLGATVAQRPGLIPAMAPGFTLAQRLSRRFKDRRLAQLFGRYATYVGGSPYQSPALLALIWQAEAAGVWHVEGGLHRLPAALANLLQAHGAQITYGAAVSRIETDTSGVTAVETDAGRRISADIVVFNGDPRALASGALGPDVTGAGRPALKAKRSLSAAVWSFAAAVRGPELAHHNVFFAADPASEFKDLRAGRLPRQPSLYICAQDRGGDRPPAPGMLERFEIIMNAPPLDGGAPPDREYETCLMRTFRTLARFGVHFDPVPDPNTLTTPHMFETLFPASLGSLYGQSPHGQMAALHRPRARTSVAGLYLTGGGAHPGAGVLMAALSAQHAVETILKDRSLPSTFHPTAMPGGISTGSATIRAGPSRS